MFEDSIAGVEAGRRAGMFVAWVPHPGLRAFCKGWEERVLEGATELGVDRVGMDTVVGAEMLVGRWRGEAEGRWREEDEGRWRGEDEGRGLKGGRRRSGDGRAELWIGLEGFEVERYGICGGG